MTGSATGNFSAALSVVGKSGRNVETVKPHGRFPTHNATTHTATRGNHRPRRHTSNSPRLSRHNSPHTHHHVHHRCSSRLHARTNRLGHSAKVRNTTRHFCRRSLQELSQLHTIARLALPDDSSGNPLRGLQAHHSQLLCTHPMGLSTDIPTDSPRTNHQGRYEHSQRSRRQEHLKTPTEQLVQQRKAYQTSSIKTRPEVRINPQFLPIIRNSCVPRFSRLRAIAEFFQSRLDQNNRDNHCSCRRYSHNT